VGNEKLLRANNVRMNEEASAFLDREVEAQSVVFVAKDDEVIGALLVSDKIRDNAREILAEAKLSGARRTVMLTGDRRVAAEAIGRQAGFDEVVADLLPAEKVEHIKRLKAEGGVVLMVGDGINDAPALATADVGVAMGLTGTDIAIETARITLATNNLDRVPKLLRIGRATMRVVKLNIAFALLVNAAGITLSVLGVISPLAASVIHEGNALLVMLNALRLLKVD
jgi:P-type E1-E2 ATPase